MDQPEGGTLIGLQFGVAIQLETDRMKLNAYGKTTDSFCSREGLAVDEFISEFMIHYSSDRVTGISYVSSIGVDRFFGKASTKSFKFSFSDQYQLAGLFGTSDDNQIYSLGAVRMKVDCENF